MLMRNVFLSLARSKPARRILPKLPGAKRISGRFVSGETLQEGIEAVRALNAKGILVTLDHLGENVFTEQDAAKATQAYLDLLDGVARANVQSSASLKLTALGLDIREDLCYQNLRRIVERAAQHNNFICIDMESTAYTERTLALFRRVRNEGNFRNVGTVIQSYLYRSEADVRALAAEGVTIRLCKGAYKEPAALAFPNKADVDKNYIKLTELFLSAEARAAGAYIAVATHDDAMISATKAYVAQHNIPKDQFEFQMLYGVRPAAQQQLVAEGYQMRVYVPYGTEWYPYYMRRLAERPANVWFILKNFFRS